MRIDFFTTSRGERLAIEEARKQGPATLVEVLAILAQIEKHGLEAPGLEFKKIRNRLWEIKDRGTPHRIFYVMLSGPRIVVLAYAFKKSEKARKQIILKAEQRIAKLMEVES